MDPCGTPNAQSSLDRYFPFPVLREELNTSKDIPLIVWYSKSTS